MTAEAVTYQSLLSDIIARHTKLDKAKDRQQALIELWDILSEFYDNFCSVYALIPGNEKKALKKGEIDLETMPMPRKKESGENQTGDLQFEISVNGGCHKRMGIAFERKSVPDFCSTILSGWKRFLRELERANHNQNIDDFRVIVEGDRLQVLAYFFPYPKICKYCIHIGYKVQKGKRAYHCNNFFKTVSGTSTCKKCETKTRSKAQTLQLIAYKRKLIGIIEALKFPVVFCGSRVEMGQYVNTAVKQYFIVNYARILNLDD
jgi:hypothetical protein